MAGGGSTAVHGLDLVTAGDAIANPAELLTSPRMGEIPHVRALIELYGLVEDEGEAKR